MARGITKSQYDSIIAELKKKGRLTASGILALAAKKTSPLHSLFEWNNTKAAEEYRLIQARKVILQANVKIEDIEDKIVHVPAIRGEGEYKRAVDVVSNISDFEMSLTEALGRLKAAEKSVNDLHHVAHDKSPDKAGILAIAMKGLETAVSALDKLH